VCRRQWGEKWRGSPAVLSVLVNALRTRLSSKGLPASLTKIRSSMSNLKRLEDGKYQVTASDNWTARLGPGVKLVPDSTEVWGPNPTGVLAPDDVHVTV
jgi:hypothetical protein